MSRDLPIVLASASPRRRELLEAVGLAFEVLPADVDETRMEGEAPIGYVRRLARLKAHAALERYGRLPAGGALLAADTVVHLDGEAVLGKPRDDEDAVRMLGLLSGRTHQVSTGVCAVVRVGDGMRERTFVETTDVTFYELTSAEIAAYVASGEPRDKAGAYGIQAMGRLLVREVCGDYPNVVGLPIARVVRELGELGYGTGRAPLPRLLLRRGDLPA